MILSGKYEVTEKVGQGGMGIVYRVRHLDLDTVLALKILPRELSQDPDLVERFRREARMMARLNHANIVRVFDFAKDGDTYYLIMEFLSGRNLRQLLQERLERTRQAFPLPDVLRVGAQIAEALAYAHGQQPAVVHRDIKPSNIIVEEGSERAVVTDFGIAKLMGESQSELTHTGLFVGTVKYCAPEQLRHDADIDARVDVYALGMLLYELYTGKQFFAGLKDHEVIGKVLYEQGENAIDLPDTPPEFNALLTRAIARDRAARHPNADALLADLQACARGFGAAEETTDATPARADDIEAQIRALERMRAQRLAEEAKLAAEAARADAERAGAPTDAAAEFAAAAALQEEGAGLFAEGEYDQAGERLRAAAEAFTEAAGVSARRRAERAVAQAREVAEELKRQAAEGGAAELAPAALARADAVVQTAEGLVAAGDYDRAAAEFGEAAEAYGAVMADVQRVRELRALEATLPGVREARRRAEEAQAPSLVPDVFTAAVRDQQRFEEALAAEQLTAAQALVDVVRAGFEAASAGAVTAHLQGAARAARAAMEARSAAARRAIGDRPPPAELATAEAHEAEATAAEAAGDWDAARVACEAATVAYEACEQRAEVEATAARAEAELTAARTACDEARVRAEEAGAAQGAPTLFGRARDLAKKAAKRAKSGAVDEATSGYRQSADQYAQAQQVAERRAQRETLEQQLAAVAEARASAEQAGAAESESFVAAERAAVEAQEALAADDLTAGARSAETARAAYSRARTEADLAQHLGEADATLALAAARRQEAADAGAETVAAAAYAAAVRVHDQAVAAREANDWEHTPALAREAEAGFAASLEATLDALRTEASASAAAASAAGGAAEELAEIEARYQAAEQQRGAGKIVEAATGYREVATGYRTATDRTSAAAIEARGAAEAARGQAEAAGAATYAAEPFGRAVAAFDQARREGEAQRFKAAVAAYRESATAFEAAAATATEARQSAACDEARAAAEDEHQAAVAAEAGEHVAADFTRATEALRTAEAALAERDFSAAATGFRAAATTFREAAAASTRMRAERDVRAARDQARALRALRDPSREPRGIRRKLKRADAVLARGEQLLEGGDLAKARTEFGQVVEALEALPPPLAEDATSMATVVRPAPAARAGVPWVPVGGGLAVALVVAAWLALGPSGTADRPPADEPVAEVDVADGAAAPDAPPAVEPAAAVQEAADSAREEDVAVAPEPAPEPEQVAVAAVEPEPEPPAPEPTPPPAPVIQRVEPAEAAVKLAAGKPAAFRVQVADATDVAYEWKVDGKVVSDARQATMTMPVPEEPRTVTVVARNAGGSVEHQWRVAALPRATAVPPPVRKPPEIVAASPGGRSLSLDVGTRQRFSVKLASADDSVKYAWSVDGRRAGGDATFDLTPRDDDEGETRQVRVGITDADGKTASREWTVRVPAVPIRIVGQRPATDATYPIGTDTELSVDARVGSRRDAPLEYRWSVDGRRLADARGPSLRHTIENPETRIEVSVEAPGRQAAVRRWRLQGERPAEPEPTVNPEGEIRAWIEAYRAAYEQKNVDRLVALGVLTASNRDRMRDILDDLDELQVRVARSSIKVEGPDRAVVSLTRVDSFAAGRGREEKSIPITKTLRKRNGLWIAD